MSMVETTNLNELASILASSSIVTRRVEIFEADGETRWDGDPGDLGIQDGSVSVVHDRAERRMLELSLHNEDNVLQHDPDGFWYDKIIKVYRGVISDEYGSWERQLGEFMIDTIQEEDFPAVVQISGRDYTKKLILSKFPQTTTFPEGQPAEELIKTIALNGGITKMILPGRTDKVTAKEYSFESNSDRWTAIRDIAVAHGFEVYFNPQGYMVVEDHHDPLLSPLSFTFLTGNPNGNVSKYTRSSNDTRIFNSITVIGESNNTPSVWATAKNTNNNSPTSISRLGERSIEHKSSIVTTFEQAQDIANSMLATLALEEFVVNIEALVVPWLDVGKIMAFIDPNPAPYAPTRYLLSELNIPLALGTMSVIGRRVTVVG